MVCIKRFLHENIYIYILYILSRGIYQPENLMSNGSSRHDNAAQYIYIALILDMIK